LVVVRRQDSFLEHDSPAAGLSGNDESVFEVERAPTGEMDVHLHDCNLGLDESDAPNCSLGTRISFGQRRPCALYSPPANNRTLPERNIFGIIRIEL
jgi:hypothetical protein